MGESKNNNFLQLPPTFRESSASRANTYIYFRRPSADLPPVGRTLISHFRWASADLPPVAWTKKMMKIFGVLQASAFLPRIFRLLWANEKISTFCNFRRPSADLPPVGRTLIIHFRWASADLPPVARSKKLIKILVLPHTFSGSSAHMLGLLCRLCCPVFLTLLGNLCLESLVIDNYQ